MKTFKAYLSKALVCWLALAVASASVLGACGNQESVSAGAALEETKKDEDAIRTGVSSSMDIVLTNIDDEFLSHLFCKLTYDITSVTVSDERAVAQVRITHADYNAALERAQERMQIDDAPTTVAQLYHEGEDEELFSYLTEAFYTCLDETNETVACDVSLSLTKQGSEWSLESKSLDALVDALLGT